MNKQIVNVKNIVTYKKISNIADCIPSCSKVFVIIDNNLKPFLNNFEKFNVIEIETSEKTKTFESVTYIVDKLLELGADRECFILGVGGGITTDIVGFVASIYKRGVKFGFIPTTLLAQVDASIGGKNGVNFHSYKNIMGVINQPEFVYVCSEVLTTLQPKEFKAGISEALKTFILFNKEAYNLAVEYFCMLEEYRKNNNTYINSNGEFPDQDTLTKIIGLCAEYKGGVVERDEFERGERRLLNLGHTFAHAIEKLCGEAGSEEHLPADREVYGEYVNGIMHGEAVSIGLVLAAKLAKKLNPTAEVEQFAQRVKEDLIKMGLPVSVPAGLEMQQLIAAVGKDKKVSGSGIHFILPFGLEQVEDRKIELKELEELAYDLC